MGLFFYTRLFYLSHLFNIIFLVTLPCNSICRKMHFVAGGPFRVWNQSLCCQCTNRVHCTHINLKIVCCVCCCLCAPRSLSPVPIKAAIVCKIIIFVVWACRHAGIWYFVPVLYSYRFTYWTTKKRINKNQTNKKKQ